jgi:hypothetical protein
MKAKLTSLFFFLILGSHQYIFSQVSNFIVGPAVTMGYEHLGAVKSVAGIMNDKIYIVENDYGRAFDFKNNIRTSVSCFSTKTGEYVNRFSLNDLVAHSKKEIDKVLFCDVVTWKNKLVGFYTYKNPAGKSFLASALVCNADGQPQKSIIEIGEFVHNYSDGSFLWQGGLLVNGRNTLSVSKDFQYRFCPDSSRLLILCAPLEDKSKNIRFKIFDSNLETQKEIAASIPLQEKVADLIEFSMDNKGIIYLLTKTYKSKKERSKIKDDDDYLYQIFTINTNSNNDVKSVILDLPGKAIADLQLGYLNGVPMLAGSYTDLTSKKSKGINGAFTIKTDPDLSATAVRIKAFPDSLIEKLESAKAVKKGEGIGDKIRIRRWLQKEDGGLYAFASNEYIEVMVQGSTGALNTYTEVTGNMIFYSINTDGTIGWERGFIQASRNREMGTRSDRVEFIEKDHHLVALYAGPLPSDEDKTGLVAYVYDEHGRNDKIAAATFDKELQQFRILENGLRQLSKNEYIAVLFSEGKRLNDGKVRIVRFVY